MKTVLTFMFVVSLLAAGAARADSLDGDWCSKDGRRLHIEGPNILTPGGSRMQGRYERHTFSYTVPAGEPAARRFVFLQQWSDEKMTMYTGADEAAARQGNGQEWNRCAPATS